MRCRRPSVSVSCRCRADGLCCSTVCLPFITTAQWTSRPVSNSHWVHLTTAPSKMSDFCLISAVCVHTVGFDCALVQKLLLPSKAPQSCVWLYSATVLTCLHLTHTYKASTSSYTWESEHYRHSTDAVQSELHQLIYTSVWLYHSGLCWWHCLSMLFFFLFF